MERVCSIPMERVCSIPMERDGVFHTYGTQHPQKNKGMGNALNTHTLFDMVFGGLFAK